jgi:hypothetical protein
LAPAPDGSRALRRCSERVGELRIFYQPREDATLKSELDALAAAYRFLIESSQEKAAKPAPEPNDRNDAAIVGHMEGVSHVEQRPDRPSEIL